MLVMRSPDVSDLPVLIDHAHVFDGVEAAYWTCEVNLRPENDASISFHSCLGFVEVGRQMTEGGAKEVALLAKKGLESCRFW